MKTWDFKFTGNWSAGFIILTAVIAILLSLLFYRAKLSRLSPRIYIILNCLRALAIVIAALFLLKPVIRCPTGSGTQPNPEPHA